MRVFLDLCTSLGGASKAFDDSDHWRTIKIDNAEYLLEHHRGMILQDITDTASTLAIINKILEDWGFVPHKDTLVIWASPPCNQFSFANAARDPLNFDFTVLEACLEIIDHLPWDYWLIENVHGAVEPFSKILDHYPRQTIGPLCLWGHFPLIAIEDRTDWKHRKMEAKGSRLLRPHNRALVPEPVSQGLRSSLENQSTLQRWA